MVESPIKIKSEIMINVDVSCKNYQICKKDDIWYPATCSCENRK